MLLGDQTGLLDQPDLVLALSLSAPASTANIPNSERQFTVELKKDEIVVRSPLPRIHRARQTHLLCTKEAIASATLLHEVWRQRSSPDDMFEPEVAGFERYMTEAVLDHARFLGEMSVRRRSLLQREHHPFGDSAQLFERLDIPSELMTKVDTRCHDLFRTLEQKGWAIDPGFTLFPEIMVLLGLVPMQWSVRTPEGERVYREIRLNAPLWNLSIDRIREGRQKRTDWQFSFRGISFIRGLLRRFAEQYLAAEEQARRAEGQPILPPPQNVTLDQEDG